MLEENENEVRAEANIFISNGITYSALEIPGFGKDDIDAYIQDDTLIIEGTRTPQFGIIEDLEYSDTEFKLPFTFKNKIQLDRNVKVDNIKVENGICLIQFEKVEAEKTSIEVK